MAKNLVIVESPAKAKTIEKYLGKDYKVMSSFGHIRDLPKTDAIDIENGFAPKYVISADKKKVVSDLKKEAKDKKVWLASDEDREGEAIAWHVADALGLDSQKTERIVFHEITKNAILKAIENPRKIDQNLVNAQQARRVLDRLVGFELSPVLWKKIKAGLSAGRVQSVAVRLIVEKEREIQAHSSKSSYRVVAEFSTDDKALFKAELAKNLANKDEAQAFLAECKSSNFSVNDLQKKPGKRTPAAPFTTSTLQQEASRKLGFSVAQTMRVAQQLYESGAITYMRTDSVNLSNDALKAARAEIVSHYGEEYHKQRNYKSKAKGAQEAHEAIRPTNFANIEGYGDRNQMRLYQLIWKRTVASQMADAQIENSTVTIDVSDSQRNLVAKGEVIKFEGFIKAYLEGTDDENVEEAKALPAMKVGENLSLKKLTATERFSRPPARYTEASLVKKLEELGIGRPSTYAPTISTVQKRGYVEKPRLEGVERKYVRLTLASGNIKDEELTEITGADRNKLVPTDIGIVVNDYLVEHFDKIMDYNFTAQVEEEFDKIAEGQLQWNKLLETFYGPFHNRIETATETEGKVTGERVLGNHPESGLQVIARIGRYGPMVQVGETGDEKNPPKFASIPKNSSITSITLEDALDLFQLPKTLGEYQDKEVLVNVGRFGPYVKHGDMFVSLDRGEEPLDVDLNRAVELIDAKQKADAPIAHYENMPVQKGVGRFGPYLKWNSLFINVNKKYDFDNLTEGDIKELIEDKKKKEREKVIQNWADEGIRIEKARWGRFNILQGKTKIEMPKDWEASKVTLAEVKEIIEKNAPKKKATRKKTTRKKSSAKK